MKRNFKPLVVVAAMFVGLILTVTRHGGNSGQGSLGLGVGQPLSAAPSSAGDKKPYDLTALHIFDSALKRIDDNYVDPTRIDPRAMLLSSLDHVQKEVAEVLVEPHPEKNKVVVRVDNAQQEFDISDVDSPWSLSHKMREIFKFVGANVQPATDLKQLEYAATNGMLSTLDPHSVLLDPQTYGEMRLTTRGHFGGLGIVIGIRKGVLTVIRPMPNTPASGAGIKAGDHIVRIEKLSTTNMMLNDAVSRLRGEPDTKVEVWMQRADTPARRLVLTRAIIQVETVDTHALKDAVGYIRLRQFSGNTVEDMRKGLEELKAKNNLKGLVLDLRGDPGGLLDQAIKVADEFLDSGTIVTTVGYANKQRDEKRATPGNQPKIPIAVLVNGGSASASEIVAGALKNLDRAVIVGTRTFGKGSVQVLYDNDDNSALKLTIAQYLTPGDVSIQSVGIMPDVLLEPAALAKDRVAIFADTHGIREQDLDAHLTSHNTKSGDKAIETLRYLAEAAKKKEGKPNTPPDVPKDDDGEAEPPDDESLDEGEKFVEDYQIVFARELLAQAKGWHRHEVLASSRAFFDRKIAEEQGKLADGLKKLGVDWTPVVGGASSAVASASNAPGTAALSPLVAQLTSDRPANAVAAGEVINLKASVTNRGSTPVGQVRGITHCDDPFLDNREFVFGRIAPGETRSWTVPLRVEKGALPRLDPLKLEVSDERGNKAETENAHLRIDGLAHPRFAYAYQLIDDVKGNGDGLVERGEEVRLHVTVKNVGDGKSFQTQATVSSKSGEGLDVNKGRFAVDNIAPGEARSVDFTVQVAPDYKGDSISLQMDVYDQVLHEYVTDKLTFPVVDNVVNVVAAEGSVSVLREAAEVRAGATADTASVGHASKGASFKLTGRAGGLYRIDVEPNRPAFIAATDAKESSAPVAANATAVFAPTYQVAPPRLVVADAPLAVTTPVFKLKVDASDDHSVADSFVFVSNRTAKIDHRKVFYRSNRKGSTPNSLRYEAEIPIWPGINQVTVVARQSNQVQSAQTLIVAREGGSPAADQPDQHAARAPGGDKPDNAHWATPVPIQRAGDTRK